MKILELLERTTEYFTHQGVASPRLQIELLLAHVLKLPRMQLYLQFERLLTPAELDALRPLVKRRAAHEPLQYLTGSTAFHGLNLACKPGVLIPRPETEVLVDLVQTTLANRPPGHLLDLGTGSGAIALALAKALPDWTVSATDISPEALDLARANQATDPDLSRVRFLLGELLAGAAPDVLVSNPPYLTDAEMAALPPEVQKEPVTALHGGTDGLDVVRRILAALPSSVKLVAFELGLHHTETVANLLAHTGFTTIRREKDLAGVERFILAER
ncbi:MAG: peptide chain release factor N(5)-glutamine methyltransferase [Candidatus Methylacidiphilales bacterium]|nr:peptide chain release factor N(5)-glutamine methyltransferase [Candidatus Methylacidiphilales bacterium]